MLFLTLHLLWDLALTFFVPFVLLLINLAMNVHFLRTFFFIVWSVVAVCSLWCCLKGVKEIWHGNWKQRDANVLHSLMRSSIISSMHKTLLVTVSMICVRESPWAPWNNCMKGSRRRCMLRYFTTVDLIVHVSNIYTYICEYTRTHLYVWISVCSSIRER